MEDAKEYKYTGKTLKILNVLMRNNRYMTTQEIMDSAGCSRRAIPSAVDALEINGFGIDVIEGRGKYNQNKYKYRGVYGL